MNYLYNGVELPALPTIEKLKADDSLLLDYWDGTDYPPALLCDSFYTDYDGPLLIVCMTTFVFHPKYSVSVWDGKTPRDAMIYKLVSSQWEYYTTRMFNYESAGVTTAFWTNKDIYYCDENNPKIITETLAITASDPIPVGTAPQLDPLSMWLGWKAGNWVARQRGKA